jgi:hypothetical protein
LRQAHLSDGGAGLQFVDIGGTLLETEAQHAFGDGAGADEHDLLAQGAQAGDLRGPAAMAAWSSPRPSLVTSEEPTLMMMRVAF